MEKIIFDLMDEISTRDDLVCHEDFHRLFLTSNERIFRSMLPPK